MKRITLFCGHFGSGKTNVAVNYALYLREEGKDVTIADLDIVNPYFRTKDSEGELRAAGVEVISLPFANTSTDLPAMPSQAYSLVQNTSRYAVLDIGGDDRGAYALGRFAPAILKENNYENLFVVNFHRPLTRNAADALEILREIEAAGGVPVTGIVNNSNLGEETTVGDIVSTAEAAQELSRLAGIPVVLTTVRHDLTAQMSGEGLFGMKLQKKYW